MSWLFARQLRPFVLLAGVASLVLNLALLVPAIYMLQVFDRVFASRSVETLVMLSLLAALALGLANFMDTVRAVEVPTGVEDEVELYALFSEISVGDAP